MFDSKKSVSTCEVCIKNVTKDGTYVFAPLLKGMNVERYKSSFNGITFYTIDKNDYPVEKLTAINTSDDVFAFAHKLQSVDWKNIKVSPEVREAVFQYNTNNTSDMRLRYLVVAEIRRITGVPYKMNLSNFRTFLTNLTSKYSRRANGNHELKPMTSADMERAICMYILKNMEMHITKCTTEQYDA